jgi:Tfp pilus assembly protein PilX
MSKIQLLNKLRSDQRGSFLIMVLVIIILVTSLGVSVAALTTVQYQHTKRAIYAQNAELVAEAGIEQTVHQLNTDDGFVGYTSAQTFFDNSTQGRGTFTTAVSNNADDNSKTIVSTGKIYRRSADTNPYLTRAIRVTVVGTSSSGYSVYSGPGGLILDGTSSIANSNVYVGGTLTMNGNSSIGTNINPVGVDVANKACPTGSTPGPTYPQVCTDGSQPIILSSNSKIYGTVCATGQTSTGPNNNIQTGNGGAGLKIGCTAPTVTQPVYDRSAQIAAVTTTTGASTNPYPCTTWAANLKLTGNVSTSGNCTITISGNAYITGNLSIGGNTTIRVADSLGTTRPVIMVDGSISTAGNSNFIANSSGSGIDFVSYKNSTGDPAATVTGNNLKTSQSLQTITLSGNGAMPGMVFDAYWSKVYLGGTGQMGAAVGQTVELAGNGTVIFGTELSSGSKTWAISSYQPL